MRIVLLAGFAGLIVLLSGCSVLPGGGDQAVSAPARPAPVAVPAAPTTGPWTIEQAQLEFQRDVAPADDEAEDLYLLLCTCAVDKPVNRITDACRVRADVDETLIDALSTGQWPTGVEGPMPGLIHAVGVERSEMLACANQTTTLTALVALDHVAFAGPAAHPVLVALGLAAGPTQPGTSTGSATSPALSA